MLFLAGAEKRDASRAELPSVRGIALFAKVRKATRLANSAAQLGAYNPHYPGSVPE